MQKSKTTEKLKPGEIFKIGVILEISKNLNISWNNVNLTNKTSKFGKQPTLKFFQDTISRKPFKSKILGINTKIIPTQLDHAENRVLGVRT